jgi:hypothetical protein
MWFSKAVLVALALIVLAELFLLFWPEPAILTAGVARGERAGAAVADHRAVFERRLWLA